MNRKCPHGVRWYHASIKCFNCTLEVLQEEELHKKEKDMINTISESQTPTNFPVQGTSPNVWFFLTQKDAVPPYQAYDNNTGYDLTATDTFTIKPQTLAIIPTGVVFDILKGYYGQIHPKSGLALKNDLTTDGGVIDTGYKSKVKVLIRNYSKIQPIIIQKG